MSVLDGRQKLYAFLDVFTCVYVQCTHASAHIPMYTQGRLEIDLCGYLPYHLTSALQVRLLQATAFHPTVSTYHYTLSVSCFVGSSYHTLNHSWSFSCLRLPAFLPTERRSLVSLFIAVNDHLKPHQLMVHSGNFGDGWIKESVPAERQER